MAINFKTQQLVLTKQLVTASGDGLLYVNGIPVVSGVSGALNQSGLYLVSQIVATGNSAVVHANGIGANLSGNLAQTGATLLSQIAQTGSQAWNAANNNGINLSGNLYLTGANLYALITGASGQATGDYATKFQLTQTGVSLGAKTDALSGYVNAQDYVTGLAAVLYASGASGFLSSQIAQTGAASIAFALGGDTNLSGNLTLTGQTLTNRSNALSGWTDQMFVHRTGYELVSGRKFFVQMPLVTGTEYIGASGSGVYSSTLEDGVVAFGGASGSVLTISSGVVGSIFAVTDQYESPLLDIYDDGRVYLGQFLSNTLFISGIGASFGVDYVPTGYNVFISGATQYIGHIYSGTTGGQVINIADLFYPRVTNPSGYVTGGDLFASGSRLFTLLTGASGSLLTTIAQTGATAIAFAIGGDTNLSGNLTLTGQALNNNITSVSGWTDRIFVHRTGQELISGTKGFITSIAIGASGATGLASYMLYAESSTPRIFLYATNPDTNSRGWIIQTRTSPVTGLQIAPANDAGVGLSAGFNIDRSSNVGININAPAFRLDVNGDINTSGVLRSGSTDITNLYYPRNSNPSGFITGLAGTGSLATLNQLNSLSGYVNSQDALTGQQAWSAANNNAINLSGNLTSTGQALINRDNSISGWTDTFFVHRTGNELITGIKTFINSVVTPIISGTTAWIYLDTATALDASSVQSMDWQGRVLTDTASNQAIDWNNRFLANNLSTITLNWQQQNLRNGPWFVSGWNNSSGSIINYHRLSGLSGYLDSSVTGLSGHFISNLGTTEFYYGDYSLLRSGNLPFFSGIPLNLSTGDIVYLRYDKDISTSLYEGTRNFRPYIVIQGSGVSNNKTVITQTGKNLTLYKIKNSQFLTNGHRAFTFTRNNPINPLLSGYRNIIIRPRTTSTTLRFDLTVQSGISDTCTGFLNVPKFNKNIQNINVAVNLSFEKDTENPNKSVVFIGQDLVGFYTNNLISVTGYGIDCTETINFSYINTGTNEGGWVL